MGQNHSALPGHLAGELFGNVGTEKLCQRLKRIQLVRRWALVTRSLWNWQRFLPVSCETPGKTGETQKNLARLDGSTHL
jgi:hypothetical protein